MVVAFVRNVLPGLAVGGWCGWMTYQWLSVNHHPNIEFLTFFWGVAFFGITALWQHQVDPRFVGKRLTAFQKGLKFAFVSAAGLVLGFFYGASLTPPHADPGQTLGGILFGLIGGLVGSGLGWTWHEPPELANPDIGFEV